MNTGRRGDEVVSVVVATPKKLTKRQQELIEQLGEELGGSSGVRVNGRTDNGWFDRMKSAFTDED